MRERSHSFPNRQLRRSLSADLPAALAGGNVKRRFILMPAVLVFACASFPILFSVSAHLDKGPTSSLASLTQPSGWGQLTARAPDGQQRAGTIRGQVTDQLGGAIVGATVTITDANGLAKTAETNGEGLFVFDNLIPGRYTVRATAPGFAPGSAAIGTRPRWL